MMKLIAKKIVLNRNNDGGGSGVRACVCVCRLLCVGVLWLLSCLCVLLFSLIDICIVY